MKQAQRAPLETPRRAAEDEADQAPALDERSVLDVLEATATDEESPYRPLVGIRNGLLIGLGFWAVVLAVLGIAAGLGLL